MAVTNGTAALDYDGNGVLDTNIGFSTNVTIDYSASGPLGTNISDNWPEGDIPGYFHVAAEFDTSGSVMNYGASQTEAHIGHDMMTNSIDWTATPGNSMTLINQAVSALPWQCRHS